MDDITLLERLLSIPSPSGHEEAVASYLAGQMAARGFSAHIDEAGNVVGSIGGANDAIGTQAKREIVLLGHMDTVPGHIETREVDGRLYGRGAVDAKGPLAAFVLATAQAAPNLSGTRVTVIGAVEEESHSRGARHLASTIPAPDYAIIGEPSHWQGVTLGYKGIMSFNYQLQQPNGHSAGQHPSPAETAVALWNRLEKHAIEHNAGRSGRFDTLDPALQGFCTSSDGLNSSVTMDVSVRIPLGHAAPDLQQQIKKWSNGATVRFNPIDPPIQSEKNTPLVRAMLRAIRAEGGQPRFKLKTGTSDMNVVGPAWDCPIVAYGPGDSSLDHTPDEHIEIDEFRRAVDVLAHALVTLAN